MRWMLTALILTVQAAPLPPAYPRPGATRIFENDRVQVWDIAWLKQQYPLHRHVYDLIGVYYSPGDRIIVSESGARRPVSTAAWNTAFQRRGVTHVEEGASDVPLKAVFVEIKDEQPRTGSDAGAGAAAPAFPADAGKQLVDNDRATIWEFVPAPGPAASPHRHVHDAVVVSFADEKPRVSFITRGTVHTDDGASGAARLYVFEIK
jgi:hypothetical protein